MDYSRTELMVVAGARELHDHELVFVGTGLPIVASFLAKGTHAPDMILVVETGPIDPRPVHTPMAVADPRVWYRAVQLAGIRDVLGSLLQRGLVDVGFLGGAQTDRYGNVNSTLIGSYERPKVRLPGSGGACDIAALARRTIIITKHEKRRFPERVDYVTSPGYITGGDARAILGLSGGPSRVITDLCVFGFNERKEAELVSFHPGVDVSEVVENTGFEIAMPKELKTTDEPTAEELKLLRENIDPDGIYLG